jgi:hypothetical protein
LRRVRATEDQSEGPRVQIAKPMANQQPVVDSPKRYKILRCGRRWGKTRIIFYCAIVGHGPQSVEGRDKPHFRKVRGEVKEQWYGPKWRGISQGWDVAWVVRDMPQANTLWEEEIVPRFKGVEGVYVNEQKRQVRFPTGGTLWIRSAENINSVRGAGAKLIGVVVDEAAWQDLKRHIQTVLRPAMMDNGAWLFLASTTNAGKDGNPDQRIPSYFNILCEEEQNGLRPKWAQFHGTAYDNPKLDPDEVKELIDEYTPGSVELEQEVHAKLVTTGAGVAFPEWNEDAHVARYEPPRDAVDWVWTGGGDWGLTSPGALYLIATGPERSLVRLEFAFNGRFLPDTQKGVPMGARQIGYLFGKMIRDKGWPVPEWIAVDTPSTSDNGPSILEKLEQGYVKALGRRALTAWVNPPKGTGSRHTKKALLHDMLRYRRDADGKIPDWGLPDLQVHPSCNYLITSLPKLVVDEKDPEDVNSKGDDHAYDSIASWVMNRTPEPQRKKRKDRRPDKAPDWLEVVSMGKGAPPERERRRRAQAVTEDVVPERGRRWTRVRE